jgi:hypothetical protein
LGILAGCAVALLAGAVVSAQSVVTSKLCAPFASPVLSAPATNTTTGDSSVHVAGNGEPNMVVSIRNGSIGLGAATIAGDGSFAMEVPLTVGDNNLVAREVNDCNTVRDSNVIVVHRSAQPTPPAPPKSPEPPKQPVQQPSVTSIPPIESVVVPVEVVPPDVTPTTPIPIVETPAQKQLITSVQSDQTVATERLWLSGVAEPYSTVDIIVNNVVVARVVASSEGRYGVLVGLVFGANTIKSKATAPDGTVTTRTIKIKLDKSVRQELDTDGVTDESSTSIVTLSIIAIIAGGAILISIAHWHLFAWHRRRKYGKH